MIVRIDYEHPLSLDTHICDREGKEHFFRWIEIYGNRMIAGEEVFPDKPYGQDYIIHKQEGEQDLGFDYFIKGIKNPTVDWELIQHVVGSARYDRLIDN